MKAVGKGIAGVFLLVFDLMGFDIQRQTTDVKAQIGVVPESSNLYDELTCLENLLFMGQLYGVAGNQRVKRAEELIQLFRLEGKRDTLFSRLSKGMKRNLTIAAALVHAPPVIFLDEPTSGLDVMNARNLRAMIRHLNQQGVTVFLTTHNIEEANALCDRVGIINHGELVVQGDVSKLLEREATEYSIQASPLDAAIKLIGDLPWANVVSTENGKIDVHVPPGHASELNRVLVTHAIDVSSFYPHRTLEDFFLRITEGTSEI